MKWYHYTGLKQFNQIIIDGALLSFYQRCYREDNEMISKCGNIEKFLEKERRFHGEKEYQRRNYIYLTQNPSHPTGMYNEVVLGFELDEKPNLGSALILPRINLENLIDIGTKATHLLKVIKILEENHNGKYGNISVYINKSCV